MTLPSSGQISFDDFNTELGRATGTQIDMKYVADTLGISYNTLGTNDLQMDEFHSKSILGNFTYATAGVSGFVVAQNGSVTPPTVSNGSIASLVYSSGYSGGSYPIVNSSTNRSVTVTVNIPYGYNNTGTVSDVETYTQIATPTFTFGDWNGSVSVSQGGSVSYVTGNAAAVSVSPTSFGIVNVDTNRDVNVTVTVPSGYYNSGQTVSGTKTATQPLTQTFSYSDWNGSVSVAQDGTVSYVVGNAQSVSVSPTSFGLVNVDTSRTVNVTVTVPGGYYNSGGTVSGTRTVTQSLTPTFAFSDANVTGFVVYQNGAVDAPTAQYGTIASLTYSSGYSFGSYPTVYTNTLRSVDVVVNVPSGYYNTGGTVSGTLYYTQAATILTLNLSATPGCYNNGFTTQTWVTLDVDDSINSFYYYWSTDNSTWYAINVNPVVGSYGQYYKSPGIYYFKAVDSANSSRYATSSATISSC